MKSKLVIKFDHDKNEILRAKRDVSFEDVELEIESGRVIGEIEHPNKQKYPSQRILIVRLKEYIHKVPFVFDKVKNEMFLKTIYPSSKENKKYEKK